MYCATFFKADCEGLSSVALLSSHMPFPSCTGPTLIDTQSGSMKHCTRQLPSLATFTDLITWPCSAFPFIGSLKIIMRLYSEDTAAKKKKKSNKNKTIRPKIPQVILYAVILLSWINNKWNKQRKAGSFLTTRFIGLIKTWFPSNEKFRYELCGFFLARNSSRFARDYLVFISTN